MVSGSGFAGALQVLFIGLKLTGHIDWSWWWVMSPCWGELILIILILVVGYIVDWLR